jgi:hypothetical protein
LTKRQLILIKGNYNRIRGIDLISDWRFRIEIKYGTQIKRMQATLIYADFKNPFKSALEHLRHQRPIKRQ